MGDARQFRAIVSGRVQGVSFRAYTASEARRLDLSGFVRNLANGSVEVVAAGPEEALLALRRWLDRGSPHARVDDLAIDWSDSTRVPYPFTIL